VTFVETESEECVLVRHERTDVFKSVGPVRVSGALFGLSKTWMFSPKPYRDVFTGGPQERPGDPDRPLNERHS